MEEKDKKYKQILLETFSSLIKVLEDNNLRWFVGYGTLLGTIRHKGFIPWDDDIDIIMPRPDYEKLINILKDRESPYTLVYDGKKKYTLMFGKYYDTNTTIVELKYSPMSLGVYIDIFPFDMYDTDYSNVNTLRMKYQSIHKKYIKSKYRYPLRFILSCLFNFRVFNLYLLLSSTLFRVRTKKYYRKMKEIEGTSSEGQGKYCVCLSGLLGEREILNSEWLSDFIRMPFENLMVRVPIGYDVYLNHYYGEYMKYPPVEQQIARHPHVYENLEVGMEINEARKYFSSSIEHRTKHNYF